MNFDIASFIDHTLLKPGATEGDVLRLCDEAARWRFASVCINPVFVAPAAARLSGTSVRVCTVVGFPLGASATEIKVTEARHAVSRGAREIDMVMWIGALKEGKPELVREDIARVVQGVRDMDRDVIVKVIIETCLLTDEEKVLACRAAENAGANFVKTSTGFSSGGATVPDVALMRNNTGPHIGVKASGGIRTANQALDCIRAGANRIGTSSGVGILLELADFDG